jgi:CheY-like chemotaxis protein
MIRVLYIDDIPESGQLVELALKLDGRCALAVATSALEALTLISQACEQGTPFRAAVVDIAMPGVDGYTFARMLREMERGNAAYPTLRLAFATAHGEGMVDKAGIAAVGGEHCWFRPDDMERIADLICDWLGCDDKGNGNG